MSDFFYDAGFGGMALIRIRPLGSANRSRLDFDIHTFLEHYLAGPDYVLLDHARTGDPTPRPHESEECLFTPALLDWTFKRLLTEPLPLIRMLERADVNLAKLLASSAADGAATGRRQEERS